jgi:EAL domain-containing protein (putative c-di-GMP-specific phosphodiesterase class I)
LLPDTFITIAENTLIDLLMRRVLDSALSQLAVWEAQGL